MFFHGVRNSESPTSIIPPAPCEAAMPVYFGTAPVHRTVTLVKKVNYPILANGYDGAVLALGYDQDWSKWTLCENVYAQFALFAMSPCVFVNVFDPAVHKIVVAEPEALTLAAGSGKLSVPDVLLSSVVVKDSTAETTYELGKDYTVAYDSEYKAVITRVSTGTIATDTDVLSVTYDYADPSKVDKDDVIGGINVITGNEEGLEVIEKVFPLTRKVPGLIVATGWSEDSEVAAVMASKAWSINGLFKAVAIVDIPVTGEGAPDQYSEVPAYKETQNLTDDLQHAVWPMLKLGDTEFRYSSQFAALVQWTTHHKGKDIPYVSPSNQNIKCDALISGAKGSREEVMLSLTKANYLNENGITTALNWIGGWRAWGNRNACYPASTDTKDVFLPIRMMFNWVEAQFILSFWQKVDGPITRRLVESIVDSFNDRLNGLTAQEAILGGRIEFRKADNPVSNLLDGKIKFKTYLTPPPPAEEISNDFELDPDYFSSLFGSAE